MSNGRRSSFGTPVPLDEIELLNSETEQLFAESDRLIESIYDTLYNSGFSSPTTNMRAGIASSSSDISPSQQLLEETPILPTISSNESPSISLQESLDEGRIDAEIARIHRYCETIENNLASMGLNSTAMSRRNTTNDISSPGEVYSDDVSIVSASTPLNVRRRPNVLSQAEPVEVIDLSLYDNIRPVPMIVNAGFADDVIDLCSPDISHQHSTINNFNATNNTPRPSQRRLFGAARAEASSHQQQVRAIGATNIAGAAAAHTAFGTNSIKRKCDNQNFQTDDSYKCPVCLESVRSREPVSTKCGHVYCNSCIQHALRSTHKCPMCNKKMNARQIFRIYI